jgi:hypothetical protein
MANKRIAELKTEINELKQQNNNMSEQQNNPYVGRQLTADKMVHKTLTAVTLDELDTLLTDVLNDGWQPSGPMMQLQDGTFAVPTIKVPRPAGQPGQLRG